MQGLTKRQLQTLDFIRQSINQRGYPPTLREIGEHMGIRSTNGVNDHLRALERKGYLRREDMKSRALKLVESMVAASDAAIANTNNTTPPPESFDANDMVEVQILGRVAAGLPLLAEENVVEHGARRSRPAPRRSRCFRSACRRRLNDRSRDPQWGLYLRPKATDCGSRRCGCGLDW